MKTVCVAVTNDLVTDQRVRKICDVLISEGYDVTLVGRKLKDSRRVERDYTTKRFRLLFGKGALFYASYNIRLFRYLLFRKFDLIYSNDLDTLLACRMASRLKGSELIYDSHEYFTEVPELQGRKFVKGIWTYIERRIFPRLKHIITVNRSIAKIYEDKYGVTVNVMRNLPDNSIEIEPKTREELGLPLDKKIIILQGAWINVDRGGEEMVEAMEHLEGYLLLIIGGGDAIPGIKERIVKSDYQDRVQIKGRIPYEELLSYTMASDVGVTLDKDTNLNYRFSLPNKLFDYFRAGIPVVCSDLPEVKRVVEAYDCGNVTPSHDPEVIAKTIRGLVEGEAYQTKKDNTRKAIEELNWSKESSVLRSILSDITEKK